MQDPKDPEIEVAEIGGESVESTGFEREQPEVETSDCPQKGVQE